MSNKKNIKTLRIFYTRNLRKKFSAHFQIMHHFIKISNNTPYYKAYLSVVWKNKNITVLCWSRTKVILNWYYRVSMFNKSNYFKHKCIYWLVADFKIEIIDITAPLMYRAWLFVWLQWSMVDGVWLIFFIQFQIISFLCHLRFSSCIQMNYGL